MALKLKFVKIRESLRLSKILESRIFEPCYARSRQCFLAHVRSAALMGYNLQTTNVQCTLFKGSLDLLWMAETPPHERVYVQSMLSSQLQCMFMSN
jgi:hypothetical protein